MLVSLSYDGEPQDPQLWVNLVTYIIIETIELKSLFHICSLAYVWCIIVLVVWLKTMSIMQEL